MVRVKIWLGLGKNWLWISATTEVGLWLELYRVRISHRISATIKTGLD